MAGYSVKSRLRDQKSKQKKSRDKLQEKQRYIRAVLTDEQGNTSGDGSVYFSEEERLVWYRELGASQPAKVKCDEIEPLLGLPVIIGIPEGGHEREVLRVDPTVKRLDPSAGPQRLINARQLEPGGAFMMWLYTKAIVPLATVPATGLTVSIVPGDYGYWGARKSYAGTASKSLAASQPVGPNEHRLVGLYLDANNALQTVNGTVVATSSTPPEPTWPVTAYRLSVVKITDTATSFTINDIMDRRLFFGMQPLDIHNLPEEITADNADEVAIYNNSESAIYRMTRSNFLAGVSGWPFAKVITVSQTNPSADYDNIADAITAASAGDIILLDAETFTVTSAIALNKAVSLVGFDRIRTVISCATAGTACIDITAAATVMHIGFENTGTGSNTQAVRVGNGCTLRDIHIIKTGATTVTSAALYIYDDASVECTDVITFCSGSSGTNYGLRIDTATTVSVQFVRGTLDGSTYDASINSSGSEIKMAWPKVIHGTFQQTAGTISGQYVLGDATAYVASDVTKTVGSGKDFATIQEAINWFVGKYCHNCTIEVDAGDYAESLTFSNIIGTLTLQGDTRALVGIGYAHNEPMNVGAVANGGSGTCTLANSGSTITVTGSTTNPDFDAAGIVNGDVVHYIDNSDVVGSRTVSSALNTVLTFTSTAPTVGGTPPTGEGSAIFIQPNRRIVPASGTAITVSSCPGLVLVISGFCIFPTSAVGINVLTGYVTINNTLIRGCTNGINVARAGVNVLTNSATSVLECSSIGIFIQDGFCFCRNTVVGACTSSGYRTQLFGQMDCIAAIAVTCGVGMQAVNLAGILATSAGAINCTTGMSASNMSYITATSSSGNMKSNGTNYSPATSGVDGNVNSIIVQS